MKKKTVFKIVLPTVLGVFAVLGLLALFNLAFHSGDAFTKPDNGFFAYFVPATIAAGFLFQGLLVLPTWNKFRVQGHIAGVPLVHFIGMVCLVFALLFGWLFWERDLGLTEFVQVAILGGVAMLIYLVVNLKALKVLVR